MSNLLVAKCWVFLNAFCWPRKPWPHTRQAVPQYAARVRPGRVGRYLGGVHLFGGPAQAFALGAGVTQASPHAFGYKAALQFRHSAKDRKNHLAGGCTGVDLFGQGNKFDAESAEVFECA